MTKKSRALVVTTIGGALILISVILPWSTRTPVSPAQIEQPSPFRSLAMLGGVSLGVTIIILSFIAGIRRRSQALCWSLNLVIATFALLFYLFWLIMFLTNPFGSPPGGSISDVGLGIYAGLIGALTALTGLVFYKTTST